MSSPRPTPRSSPPPLLSPPSNSKLGPLIHSFSIPAVATCPGATPFCLSVCYVRSGHFATGSIRGRYAANLEATRSDRFVDRMAAEIRGGLVKYVRVHVAGDFYAPDYAGRWAAIAAACPRVTFFAYTRSWRMPPILAALEPFGRLPNVGLWFSEDRDSGPSPAVDWARANFLVRTAADEALVDPARHTLVFRDHVHRALRLNPGPRKRIGGVLVCPAEQWYRRPNAGSPRRLPPKIECGRCRICFPRRDP